MRLLALTLLCGGVLSLTQAQGLRASPPEAARPPAPTLAPTVPASAATAPAPSAATVRTPERSLNRIVALVDSEPITERELQLRLERVLATTPAANLPPPDALRSQVLELLIAERTQIQAARNTGVRIDAAALAEAEATVARQNGLSMEQLHERLAAEGLSLAGFRNNLEQELLLLRVREREVAARTRVSELDIDAHLRQHEGEGTLAQTALHLAHLLVAVPDGADAASVAEREARARDLLRRTRAGEDFATLARQFSDGAERAQGGVMGLRSADRYPELFVQAVRGQPRGALVGPLRSGAGFHILQVLEQRNLNLPPTHQVQTQVRHILRLAASDEQAQAAAQLLAGLRQQMQAGTARFEDLARAHSQDGSAAAGGDLGWAQPGQFVPEFEQAMNRLGVGDVSAPLRSRFGVHLIEVVQRREVETSTRERREWVRARLREQQSAAAFEEWARELRARAFVELRALD